MIRRSFLGSTMKCIAPGTGIAPVDVVRPHAYLQQTGEKLMQRIVVVVDALEKHRLRVKDRARPSQVPDRAHRPPGDLGRVLEVDSHVDGFIDSLDRVQFSAVHKTRVAHRRASAYANDPDGINRAKAFEGVANRSSSTINGSPPDRMTSSTAGCDSR